MTCPPADGVARAETQGPAHSAHAASRRRSALSLTVAGSIAAGVVATGAEEPLPTLVWAAVFLFLAVFEDVRRFRIPNWLTGGGIAVALTVQGTSAGWSGISDALIGLATAFALLLLPYGLGFLGAGDVKAVMAVGAWFGASQLLAILTWAALLGGVMGFAVLLWHRGSSQALERWSFSIAITFLTKRWTYLAPEAGSAATRALPFAAVLGVAVVAEFLWGTPWI